MPRARAAGDESGFVPSASIELSARQGASAWRTVSPLWRTSAAASRSSDPGDCQPCPADLDRDGALNLLDFLAPVNPFSAGRTARGLLNQIASGTTVSDPPGSGRERRPGAVIAPKGPPSPESEVSPRKGRVPRESQEVGAQASPSTKDWTLKTSSGVRLALIRLVCILHRPFIGDFCSPPGIPFHARTPVCARVAPRRPHRETALRAPLAPALSRRPGSGLMARSVSGARPLQTQPP
jgi:hypothetical protein